MTVTAKDAPGRATVGPLETRFSTPLSPCFAHDGYNGTSLNDIVAEVGIRRQSLLHHFASKEVLYGEVFERLLSDWFARLAGHRFPPSAGRRSSRSCGRFRLLRRQPVVRHAGPARGDRRGRATSGSIWLRCSADVRPGGRLLPSRDGQGTFREQNPEQLLLTGYGALLSYFSDAPFLEGLLDENPLAPAALERRREHIIEFFAAA